MTDDAPPAGDDQLYPAWKGWDRPFSYTPDEAAYFAGETRDLAIAGADVLDIGFGSGAFLAWARDAGARVAGIEINCVLQEAARRAGVELLLVAARGGGAGACGALRYDRRIRCLRAYCSGGSR